MFTGLVEEVGTVVAVEPTEGGRRLRVRAATVADAAVGDSVCHNGVCLTITSFAEDGYWVEAVAETLRRSNLGRLAPGSPVNLERALRVGDRLGGHMVQGHVDATAALVSATPDGDSTRLAFSAPPSVLRYVVEKGSVTLDGVSLTVAGVDDAGFAVAIIPHTAEMTTLLRLAPGDEVNVEVDVVAKYVEKMLDGHLPG